MISFFSLSRYISIQSACRSLAEFLEKFPFFTPIVAGDVTALERVAFEFVEDQAIQGVLYTETRYSPHYLTGNTLTPDEVSPVDLRCFLRCKVILQVVEAINRGLQHGMKMYPVDVRTILCCIRQTPEW